MKKRRVVLKVESTKASFDRAFSAMARPSRKVSGTFYIAFPDYETLGRVITGARIQLINAIRTEKPTSIQELARIVRRDFKNVYQDVKLLTEFGLIELKEKGPRKAATPVAKYSEYVVAA